MKQHQIILRSVETFTMFIGISTKVELLVPSMQYAEDGRLSLWQGNNTYDNSKTKWIMWNYIPEIQQCEQVPIYVISDKERIEIHGHCDKDVRDRITHAIKSFYTPPPDAATEK